jgi:hypothetical protein
VNTEASEIPIEVAQLLVGLMVDASYIMMDYIRKKITNM